jgi:uncharacterized coiled-coil protein SlyX
MRPNGRAAESPFPTTLDSWAESNARFLPGDKLAPSVGKELCSRELIARQRALVQEIKDVISLTRKIIESTREQLDALNSLNGKSRPAAAHESHSPSEADPAARRS